MIENLSSNSHFLVYQTEDGKLKIDVKFDNGTVWLSQNKIAHLFQSSKQNISYHLGNIYKERELNESETVKEFLIVQKEGSREISRFVKFYNLDAIIAVGYRVNSPIATRFRIWATRILKEYIVKGFVLDDERLKNPDLPFDYFDELLKRIQDIRTSESRFYQKITAIYATSVDYDANSPLSQTFFATVQNKVHWAISGETASEIIVNRSDPNKPNMGLTSWRGAKVRKSDVTIAKNYLSEEEISALNNLTEQYLIFAEGQAKRKIPMYMADWVKKLDGFLTLNDREILTNAGKISRALANQIAEARYEEFNAKRNLSDNAIMTAIDALEVLPDARKPTPKRRGNKNG